MIKLGSLMPGASQKLKTALNSCPYERMMEGQALRRGDDMVAVAMSDQERRRGRGYPVPAQPAHRRLDVVQLLRELRAGKQRIRSKVDGSEQGLVRPDQGGPLQG